MKTITFILSILFSATVFSQSLVEKSFPKEELFSLGSYYYPEQWDSSQWERDLKKMSDVATKRIINENLERKEICFIYRQMR